MLQAHKIHRLSLGGRTDILVFGAILAGMSAIGSIATAAPPVAHGQVAAVVSSTTTDGEGASMYRYPDISNDEIVFVYANDLWRVPIEGGTALPLASPEGTEGMPRFSPSGDEVAFMGNYGGGRDIYVVPVEGGLPR